METFTYKEVMELGFERTNSHDSVWERQYGYGYFVVYKDLPKGFHLQWDIEDHTIELLNLSEQEHVIGRMDIPSREVLIRVLKFLDPQFEEDKGSREEWTEWNTGMKFKI